MRQYQINSKIRKLMLKPFESEMPDGKAVETIDYECYVTINTKVIAVYKKAQFDVEPIRQACLRLNFPKYQRTSGLWTETVNINASPRNYRRKRYCTATKFRKEQPEKHDIFLQYAKLIAYEYRNYFHKEYAGQVRQMYGGYQGVHEAYRIKGTPFTSGVINKNSALGFHRDNANTHDGISCMLSMQKGIIGGELVLPELGIGFACQDGYILLFDGQKYIHGVSAISPPNEGTGYRYTIVYYNNKGMALCLAPEDEKVLKNKNNTQKNRDLI